MATTIPNLRPMGAGAPVDALTRRLVVLRWHQAAGEWQGVQRVLRALSDVVDDRSGAGLSTIGQVAALASMSNRHAARCLHRLEDLGILLWQRGDVVAGRKRPSRFTVVKHALAEAIRALMPRRAAEARTHRDAEASRLSGLTLRTPKRRSRWSGHVDMASIPSPSEAGTRPHQRPWEAETYCHHGGVAGKCPMCRRQAKTEAPPAPLRTT